MDVGGYQRNWGPCRNCGRPTRFAFGEGRIHCTGCEVPPEKCRCKERDERTINVTPIPGVGPSQDAGHGLSPRVQNGPEIGLPPAHRTPEQLRDEGMARAEQSLDDEPWRQEADRVIVELAREGGTFTAEDVVARVGMPSHENAVGARMAKWSRKGVIESVGTIPATRPSRHANRLLVWRGTKEAIDADLGQIALFGGDDGERT